MLSIEKYKDKNIAIYGMGITGQSTAKILKKNSKAIYCWDDDKKVREKAKKLNYSIKKFWLAKDIIDTIVISPGIDIGKSKIKNFLSKNYKKIITDLDIFFDLKKDCTIISITGTNGKSTTCKIIEKILTYAGYCAKTIGNIGNPALSLNKIKKECIYILEASSYQLQYSKLFQSKHSAILNISPDHLERHKNINNYINVKSKIFFKQKKKDFFYINPKNKYSEKIKKIFKSKKIKSKIVLVNKNNCRNILNNVTNKYFKSEGNLENLSFAYEIAKRFKINDKIIIKALNNFKGLPHRQEVILSNKNFMCINDSKATSFDACVQSLNNNTKIYWILGGVSKYKDKIELNHLKKKIIKAYIIGKKTSFFEKKIKNNIPYVISKNLKNAVDVIYKDIKLNKSSNFTILLSPAAASYDQFKNFEDRGNYFKFLIKKKFKKYV
jgi:UDP-N-acetylmuramoylalanine--D-glutamate ligase